MEIDVDELRSYLLELCGAAAFVGMDVALVDVADVEHAGGEELLAIALRLGVNPAEFEKRCFGGFNVG